MSYIYEILFSFLITAVGADGVEHDFTVSLVDGSPYGRCASNIACARIYDNHIFLDIWKLFERDSCWRNPLYHEVTALLYLDNNIHTECNLPAKIIRAQSIM